MFLGLCRYFCLEGMRARVAWNNSRIGIDSWRARFAKNLKESSWSNRTTSPTKAATLVNHSLVRPYFLADWHWEGTLDFPIKIFRLRFSNLTNDLGQFSSELGECVLGENFGTGGERPGPGLGSTSFFLWGGGGWRLEKRLEFCCGCCCCCCCCSCCSCSCSGSSVGGGW